MRTKISNKLQYIIRIRDFGTYEGILELKGYTGTVISIHGRYICSQIFPFQELLGIKLFVDKRTLEEKVMWERGKEPPVECIKEYAKKVMDYGLLWGNPNVSNTPKDPSTIPHTQIISFDNNKKQRCASFENAVLGEVKCCFRDRGGRLVELVISNKKIGMRFVKVPDPYTIEVSNYVEDDGEKEIK